MGFGEGCLLTRRQLLRAAPVALLPLIPALTCGCSGAPSADGGGKTSQRTFFCFDTVCVVGGSVAEDVLDACVERCTWFEQRLSRTIETSDVGRINAAGGMPVEVDPATALLIEASLAYSRDSGGLFDVTIGAVTELWDFHEGVVPNPQDISRALSHVGWERVRVEGDVVTLDDPDARIDLGGIAKGFVTDDLVELLLESGVESAFVNLGGNVAVIGAKPDGTPWGVGVRDPLDDTGEGSVAVVRATEGSVVTSGLYERTFEAGGRRYWHILDPRTGWPVETDVVSTSVFSLRSLDGDGLTKPLFMLPHDEALSFLEDHGVDGLLVLSDGTTTQTSAGVFELL